MLQVLQAVDFMHSKGVVHRDLKVRSEIMLIQKQARLGENP